LILQILTNLAIILIKESLMKIKQIIFILLFPLLCTQSLIGAEIGTLVIEKGVIRIRRDHTDEIYQTLNKKIRIFERDEIYTGSNTRGTLRMLSITHTVSLYSNTMYQVPEDRYETVSKVTIGKVRFKIKQKKKLAWQRKISIKTASAIIGIKGTDFMIGVKGQDTSIITIEGTVSFANIKMPLIAVDITANQSSKVTKGEAPLTPITVTPEQIRTIVKDDDISSFEELPIANEETSPENQSKNGEDKEEGDEKEEETTETPAEELEEIIDLVEEVSNEIESVTEDSDKGITITIEDVEVE
jgi:hypothetical protein